MKKLAVIFAAAILLTSLGGCTLTDNKTDKLNIVVTLYPEYDWINNILGNNPAGINVTLLLDKGVDLHSFQPSASDILKVTTSNLFVCTGGESGSWVDDITKTHEGLNVLKLMDSIENKLEEEMKEGMQGEEEPETDNDEVEYDEHIWLSLRNAQAGCEVLLDAIKKLDPANASVYAENAKAYNEKLKALDGEYKKVCDSATTKTLLFADRFPFLYMVKDYGLDYYAAFLGCSAESEASFETIAFLAGKVDELELRYVIALEGSNKKIAQTVVNSSKAKNAEILTMNSLQAAVSGKGDYLSIMTDNLNVLKKALY